MPVGNIIYNILDRLTQRYDKPIKVVAENTVVVIGLRELGKFLLRLVHILPINQL